MVFPGIILLFLAFLWTLANIEISWPHSWLIRQIYYKAESANPAFWLAIRAGNIGLQSNPGNSNLPLTRSNLHFAFYIILSSITRTPGSSNCFLFPLKVRIIGSRLYLARSGFPALVPQGKIFLVGRIINSLLTKFVRSRWLDTGLVLFYVFIDLNFVSRQNRTWPVSRHLDLTLGK